MRSSRVAECLPMSCSILRLMCLLPLLALTACATVPSSRPQSIASTAELELVADERHLRIEQYVDAIALQGTPRIALPMVAVAVGANDDAIAPTQANLVANHAARSLCNELADYTELVLRDDPQALDPRLVVTAIVPTSAAASGASSIIGVFVPGPFRLPAGLGALAVEAELVSQDGRQRAVMRWARGANSVTNDAKVSAIGDAWQLAAKFGEEFARALLDTDVKKAGMQRARVDRQRIDANRALCAKRFGTVNLAGRGASLLLPLAPEAIDPGRPSIDADDSTAADEAAPQ
jgi:hypothetical protein